MLRFRVYTHSSEAVRLLDSRQAGIALDNNTEPVHFFEESGPIPGRLLPDSLAGAAFSGIVRLDTVPLEPGGRLVATAEQLDTVIMFPQVEGVEPYAMYQVA